MLGHPSVHKPIRGRFAKELQEKLWRITTNNLNENDKRELSEIRKRRKDCKYEVIWEN